MENLSNEENFIQEMDDIKRDLSEARKNYELALIPVSNQEITDYLVRGEVLEVIEQSMSLLRYYSEKISFVLYEHEKYLDENKFDNQKEIANNEKSYDEQLSEIQHDKAQILRSKMSDDLGEISFEQQQLGTLHNKYTEEQEHAYGIIASLHGMTLEQMNQLLWFVKVIDAGGQDISSVDDICEYREDGKIIFKHNIAGERVEEEIKFPENMTVEGSFNLIDCPVFTEFPEGFKAKKDVFISGCAVVNLPDSMNHIHGELNANNCFNLEKIAPNTTVDAYCDFSNSTRLKSIHGLIANGGLSLCGCSDVKELLSQITFASEVTLSKDVSEEVKKYAEELYNNGTILGELIYD